MPERKRLRASLSDPLIDLPGVNDACAGPGRQHHQDRWSSTPARRLYLSGHRRL